MGFGFAQSAKPRGQSGGYYMVDIRYAELGG